MFLASFASMCVFVLCFDTGCFGFLLWVLQPGVVGDPLLSLIVFFYCSLERDMVTMLGKIFKTVSK